MSQESHSARLRASHLPPHRPPAVDLRGQLDQAGLTRGQLRRQRGDLGAQRLVVELPEATGGGAYCRLHLAIEHTFDTSEPMRQNQYIRDKS